MIFLFLSVFFTHRKGKESWAFLSFMTYELFGGGADLFSGTIYFLPELAWLYSTMCISMVRKPSSFKQTPFMLKPLAGVHSLGSFSPGSASNSVFLSCFALACLKADDLSLAHTEASLLPWPSSSFLQARPGHRCVLMRASLCLQGLGCSDRQLHPFALRRLEGPKHGGSEWQQLWHGGTSLGPLAE